MGDKHFTTGMVASICHVTVNGVKKWIRKGRLKAYKTPGGHYRILKEDLEEFLKDYGIPIDLEEALARRNEVTATGDENAQRGSKPIRVLVADDEATVREFIIEVLNGMDIDLSIETAADGYEALLKTGDFKPQILILDLMMPHIDGFEVCRQIKDNELTKGIKILAVTGFGTKENLKRITEYGADDYLLKPFQIDELKEKILLMTGGVITG